jgi:ATP phosphoribosyltransferase
MDQLSLLLHGAIAALDRVGLMMNVPRAKLDKILAILPALAAPTISALADERWVAVNTIVPARTGREILPQLREAGATGIVEYPLNKIVG